MTGSAAVTLPGAVEMILKSEVPDTPEIAQIALKGSETSVITIDNTLTDKTAHEVHLNAGAKVEVTIKADESGVHPLKPQPDVLSKKE
jgi:hypothetical protein